MMEPNIVKLISQISKEFGIMVILLLSIQKQKEFLCLEEGKKKKVFLVNETTK